MVILTFVEAVKIKSGEDRFAILRHCL